ncbi:MAG: hypothetical protein ACP5E3_11120 [Bacteroidales bacterium]
MVFVHSGNFFKKFLNGIFKAAAPGGPTSKLIGHTSSGVNNLSITLTAIYNLVMFAAVSVIIA